MFYCVRMKSTFKTTRYKSFQNTVTHTHKKKQQYGHMLESYLVWCKSIIEINWGICMEKY